MISSISFGPGDYKSDIFAIATGTIQALASTGDIAFGGDIDFETFYGPNTASIILGADGDYSLTVAGDVHFWAQAADVQSITQIYAANSGTVDISGGVQMNASPSNNATGGSASLSADDGLLKITGNVYMSVDDYYFAAATTDESAGTVYGGEINVTASNEGTITTGGLHLSANGTGQTATGGYEYSNTGGEGVGGNIHIDADSGGDITVAGDLYASAGGFGGGVIDDALFGGLGHGGTAELTVGDGTITVNGFRRSLRQRAGRQWADRRGWPWRLREHQRRRWHH